MQAQSAQRKQVTVRTLRAMKLAGEKIACLTAYDATFAAHMDNAGVHVVLVGDSLGMVVQGRDSTLPVSVDDVQYHCAAVRRGVSSSLLIADMPFMSYATLDRALSNAENLMAKGGAHMVKLEGAGQVIEYVERLSDFGVPVCAHLGLTPQSVYRFGGYRVQAREEQAARQLLEDAKALDQAGAEMLVLECVPSDLAAEVSRSVDMPVIGIGAGPHCDGQILVMHDMLGLGVGKRPRFVRDFASGAGSIEAAFSAYVNAVTTGDYPKADESYAG